MVTKYINETVIIVVDQNFPLEVSALILSHDTQSIPYDITPFPQVWPENKLF